MNPPPFPSKPFTFKEKGYITLLLLSVFLGVSNVMLIAPLLKFIQKTMGIHESQYGIILATYPVFSFLSSLVMGPFSDRYGRRILLILGVGGLSLSQFFTGLAQGIETLIFFRALSGIFGAFIGTSAYAYVADYFHFHARPKAMGYVAGGTALAQIAGIPIGILVGGRFQWNWVFFSFAAFSAVLTLLIIFLLPTPGVHLKKEPIHLKTYQDKFSLLLKDKNIGLSLLTYLMMFSGVFVFAGAYPTWLYNHFSPLGISYSEIALLFTVAGTGSWLGSTLSGTLSNRMNRKLLWVGLLNLGILFFIIAIPFFHTHFLIQFPLYFGMMFVGGFRFPVFSNIIVHLAAIRERGSISSAINAMVQTGSALGAFLSGTLFHLDPSMTLNVLGITVLFAASSWLIIFRLKETPHQDHLIPEKEASLP